MTKQTTDTATRDALAATLENAPGNVAIMDIYRADGEHAEPVCEFCATNWGEVLDGYSLYVPDGSHAPSDVSPMCPECGSIMLEEDISANAMREGYTGALESVLIDVLALYEPRLGVGPERADHATRRLLQDVWAQLGAEELAEQVDLDKGYYTKATNTYHEAHLSHRDPATVEAWQDMLDDAQRDNDALRALSRDNDERRRADGRTRATNAEIDAYGIAREIADHSDAMARGATDAIVSHLTLGDIEQNAYELTSYADAPGLLIVDDEGYIYVWLDPSVWMRKA